MMGYVQITMGASKIMSTTEGKSQTSSAQERNHFQREECYFFHLLEFLESIEMVVLNQPSNHIKFYFLLSPKW